MVKIIFFIHILFLLIINYGCTPANVVASSGAGTMVVAEGDRSLGTTIDDATIKFQITSKFISSDDKLFLNIDSVVIEGRVLLTGIVDTQEIRINAVRKVWEVDGVKEVINEIEIGNRESLKEYASDVWITAQAKTLSLKVLGLRAISYNFETIRGKVFVAGITSRKDQLDLLIQSIETVKGVKDIINYVVVKE